MMTTLDLENLRNKLPRDYRKELSKRTGLSSSTIYGVLNGKFYSEKVILAAIDLAEEFAKKEILIRNKIKRLDAIYNNTIKK